MRAAAQEARWAHLRALFHRGNRGGGVQADDAKGKPFLLNAVADDQAYLVYIPEFGLYADLHAQHGQSLMTATEKQAAERAGTANFNLNTMIPEWVMEQSGVKEDWTHFQRLFLSHADTGSFQADAEFYSVTGHGVLACTAEKAAHRRPGRINAGLLQQHLHRLPAWPERRIDTHVEKTVRLMIDPQQKLGEEIVAAGAVQLIYRTKVQDKVIGGRTIERAPTEAVKHVAKPELLKMVKAYRAQNTQQSTQVNQAAISAMKVDELRCELWGWYTSVGLLADSHLQEIFADQIAAGLQRWIPAVAASAPAPAAATSATRPPAPSTTARGWSTRWTDMWGWVFSKLAHIPAI